MVHAFQTDRTYRQEFTEIWRWMDWPGRSGADIGVDLVARDAEGRLVAIQCKCYDPSSTLTLEELGSFLALSGQKKWSRRIIVGTTDRWSANAETALLDQSVRVERIGIDDLDGMTVDWAPTTSPTRLAAGHGPPRRQGPPEEGCR